MNVKKGLVRRGLILKRLVDIILKKQKTSLFISTIILITSLFIIAEPITAAAADREYRSNISISVDGSEKAKIMALDHNYDRNLFISLQGLAYAVKGTPKAFSISAMEPEIIITRGVDYTETPGIFTDEEMKGVSSIALSRKIIKLDGVDRRYYTLNGSSEIFMPPLQIAMMLDMDIQVKEGQVLIDTSRGFNVSKTELLESEYLEGVNSILIGNGTTGEIYLEYASERPVPIASTTKLMTYFIMKDELVKGHIHEDDVVSITAEAAKLSGSIDGVIPMSAGQQVPLKELIYGMLLASSNECSLSIAKHVAGDEASFVDMMNRKAKELGLENSHFHNCHGLPFYSYQLLSAKMQNHMSAKDMFTLASELLKTYPEILEITQLKNITLETLNKGIKNTNAVLFNMDEVKGLKTGTTNRSGACLVSCAEVDRNGENQYLLSVLFGAEGEYDRAVLSELAIRFAEKEFDSVKTETETEESYEIPKDPEEVVKIMLKIA